MDDCTLQLDLTVRGPGRLRQLAKSPANACYFGLPVSIVEEASPETLERLRVVLTTTFAGDPNARSMDLAAESLAWMGQSLPPIMIWLKGDGGNAKSARTLLRNNVFGGHHVCASPEVFQTEAEFRKQGHQFSFARAVTIQECDPGKPIIEEVWKKFVSGENLGCRPLYGKSTAYFRWGKCCKIWETNNLLPSISGDPQMMHTLRSWVRRIRVLETVSTFSSNEHDVNTDRRAFREDSDLTSFLESSEARLAYIKHFLVPFIEDHTPDELRHLLMAPPPSVQEATARLVAQMANGGKEIPHGYKTEAQKKLDGLAAAAIVKCAHADAKGVLHLCEYEIPSKCRSLPGTYRQSSKGKASRLENLHTAIQAWPHLISYVGDTRKFVFADIDSKKFDALLTEFDVAHFGGGYDQWQPVWDCKADLVIFQSVSPEDHADIVAGRDQRFPCGHLEEVVNIVALTEALANGSITQKVDEVRAFVHSRQGCARTGDFCRRMTHYYRRHGIPGRRYPAGPSIQFNLPREARRFAFRTEIGGPRHGQVAKWPLARRMAP